MRQSPGGGSMGGFAFPRPGPVLIGLIAINLVMYVVYILLLRGGASFATDLVLVPRQVIEKGYVWQPFTYIWLHSPDRVSHLLMNMLMLYLFGATMERWWGSRRFLLAYLTFGLAGALFTLFVGSLSLTGLFGRLLNGVYHGGHIGASGAVMGVLVAWGIVHANETMNFLLIGQMKGKTFILIIIAFEMLVALSFDQTSSTSHFGGMIGAAVLCKGLWRPSKWKDSVRRTKLKTKRRKIEHQLRLLEGGAGEDDEGDSTPPETGPGTNGETDPKKWN